MFFGAQMQHMSHYYKVIVRRVYFMDNEYVILTLLVKSVEKNRPHKILISPDLKKNRDFDLLTLIAATLTMVSIVTMLIIVNVAAIIVSKLKSPFFKIRGDRI